MPQGDQPEQWRDRETDRKEESNREREEKTGRRRQERFDDDIEE